MPYLLVALVSVVGWEWLNRPSTDPETGEERAAKTGIWALAAVVAVLGWSWMRGRA